MLQVNWTVKTWSITVMLVTGWVCCGCLDETEAHLEQFLAPDAGPREAALEPIDAFEMPADPAIADRIHMMTYAEVARRLGAHRYEAHTRFTFDGPGVRAGLREDDLIVLARNGDFRVKVENDGGQGYELIVSDGAMYARNRHGPFHPRPTHRAQHLTWRDAAHGAWAAVYRLYRGRLRFTKQKLMRHHGRDALRFSVSLSNQQPRLAGTPAPPEVPDGIDEYVYPIEPTPSARDRWRDQARPRKASGTVLVDADVGVVLEVDFEGRLVLPAPDGTGDTIVLDVSLDTRTDGFGNPPSIPPPPEESVQPVPERIQVDTHPIDFYFGKGYTSSLGPPAGVAADKKQ